MQTPSLKERKDFWLWSYANQCFVHFIAGCDFFLSPSAMSLSNSMSRLAVAGAVASYAKPFTNWKGIGKLNENIVPHQHLSIHRELMDLRHKVVAHVDAIDFQADDPTFGNINQVRLKITKDEFELTVFECAVSFPRPEQAKAIGEYLHELLEQKIDSFADRYLKSSVLPSGDYILSINPDEARAFVPAAPLASHKTPFRRN